MVRMLACMVTLSFLLLGCVSQKELQAADRQRCAGYGFQPETDAFANCMMTQSNQRDAQQAAAMRARAAQEAQERAAREERDRADQDAWDRRTGQGIYAPSAGAAARPSMNGDSSSKCHSVETTTTLPDGSTRTETKEKCSSSSF